MNLIISTDVTTEPVLAADARGWLALDSTSQDTMLASIAKAARQKVERLTGKSIVERVFTYTVTMPHDGVLQLPYPPIVSITSVTVTNSSGESSTLSATDYHLVNNLLNCRTAIGYSVGVVYKAGLTATEFEKQLILKQTAWDYEHRGDSEVQPYCPDVLAEIQNITINSGF